MKIVQKIVNPDNSIFGYYLDDDGFTFAVTTRGLYDESVLSKLVEAGYKIYDYHGHIEINGIEISSLESVMNDISEEEIEILTQMEDAVLSEQEATQYFTRVANVTTVELKQPKVEIATREDFLAYLDRVEIENRYSNSIRDIRPINSFVAQDALFTVEEICANPELRRYLDIIEKRRYVKTYSSYLRLIEFLKVEGVLEDTGREATIDEVLEAYCAWGICGLNLRIIRRTKELNVNYYINRPTGKTKTVNVKDNAISTLCYMDKDGTIYYGGGSINIRDEVKPDNLPVTPVQLDEYWKELRNTSMWGSDYKLIKCLITRYVTRHCFEAMSDEGEMFEFRADPYGIAMVNASTCIFKINFMMAQLIDGPFLPLANVATSTDYYLMNLTCVKIRDLFSSKIVNPPVSSSFELLLNEGVTPEVAIQYIANQIKLHPDLNYDYDDGIDYGEAYSLYRNGLPQEFVDRYNPNDEPYDNIDDFINIAVNTRDELIAEGVYKSNSKSLTAAEQELCRMERAINPIECLTFVRSVKNGDISVNNLGQGLKLDKSVDTYFWAEMLMTMAKHEVGFSASKVILGEWIASFGEDSEYLNLSEEIEIRNNAYNGYLKDRATLNSERAKQSIKACYITKVFREISNLPVPSHRHYMFECLSLDLGPGTETEEILFALDAAIQSGIMRCQDLGRKEKDLIIEGSTDVALKLLFKIALKLPLEKVQGDENTVKVKERLNVGSKEAEIIISIKQSHYAELISTPQFERNYCTVYDWCDFEMRKNGGFNYYAINANLTPWQVLPKDGYSIPEYNYYLNYVKPGALVSLSERYHGRVKESNAKVCVLCDNFVESPLVPYDLSDFTDFYTAENIDTVLQSSVIETPDNYFNRFVYHNKAAKESGLYLVKMRLKSDEVFEPYSDLYPNIWLEEDEYATKQGAIDSVQCLNVLEPVLLNSRKTALLGDKYENFKMFDITSYTTSDVMPWINLLSGEFYCTGIVAIGNDAIVVAYSNGDKEKIAYKDLTENKVRELEMRKIVYRLDNNHVYTKSTFGDVVLEVR